LVIIAVSVAEAKADVASFVEKQGLTFMTLLDEKANFARVYKVSGIPATFFIDRDGVIRDHHIGPMSAQLIAGYMAEWH